MDWDNAPGVCGLAVKADVCLRPKETQMMQRRPMAHVGLYMTATAMKT